MRNQGCTEAWQRKIGFFGGETMPANRSYTSDDMQKLPDFIRVELVNGVFYTDDWTALEIDEAVFKSKPSESLHVTYRLSVVKAEKTPNE